MPKVLSYTPPWLSRPEPGFHLFNPSQGALSSSHKERRGSEYPSNGRSTKPYHGPTKVIAHRGTDVFVAVDNKLRWSDLCMLKDDYDEKEAIRKQKRQGRKSGQGSDQEDSRAVEADGTASGYIVSSTCGIITLAHHCEGATSQHRREDTATISLAQRKLSRRCHLPHRPCRSPSPPFQTRPGR